MGGGIWSMHFVGMLAFSLPGIEISYDSFLTLLSLVIPIVVAAAAFTVVGRRPQALLASGFAMGLGISGMHYTGMAAMRMAALIQYDPRWVVASILIAISASIVALWLAFRNTSAVQRLFAGLVMGHALRRDARRHVRADEHHGPAGRTSRRRSGAARVPARRHHHHDPEHRNRGCRL
jgi:NO-binding membrane sensor protein with MHYT domain